MEKDAATETAKKSEVKPCREKPQGARETGRERGKETD